MKAFAGMVDMDAAVSETDVRSQLLYYFYITVIIFFSFIGRDQNWAKKSLANVVVCLLDI